jgi:hypothetical protein
MVYRFPSIYRLECDKVQEAGMPWSISLQYFLRSDIHLLRTKDVQQSIDDSNFYFGVQIELDDYHEL